MRKVLYAKFNSMRREPFQMATFIVEEDGKKFVEKKALHADAISTMNAFRSHFDSLKSAYKNIQILPYTDVDEKTMKFEFLHGNNVMPEISYTKSNEDDWKLEVEKSLALVTDYTDSVKAPFEMSNGFKEVLGDFDFAGEPAVKNVNFDANFDNFIQTEAGLFCIDYEWVFDFLIPVEYIKYRTLLYFYYHTKDVIQNGLKKEEFFELFGITLEKQQTFAEMEYNFQQYVFGQNLSSDYMIQYRKTVTSLQEEITARQNAENTVAAQDQAIHTLNKSIDDLNEYIKGFSLHHMNLDDMIENYKKAVEEQNRGLEELRQEVAKRDAAIAELQARMARFKRAIKNPVYGGSLVVKRVKFKKYKKEFDAETDRKLAEIAVKQKEQDERIDAFNEKYGDNYESWILDLEKEYLAEAQSHDDASFTYQPKFSILIPVYNVQEDMLITCIDSVRNQTYTNWELVLVDDCSTQEHVREVLSRYKEGGQNADAKIKVIFREQNGGISECTNTALENATGEFIGLVDCDDVLSPFALYENVKLLNENKDLDLIYSDEDKIDDDGTNRHMPNFKPDWSPDTLMSYMYICHFSVYRREIAKKIGGFRKAFDGAQDFDFALRFTEETEKIGHIQKVLYHWRERKESTAGDEDAKPYVLEASRKCREEALSRRGWRGHLEDIEGTHQMHLVYDVQDNPLVSIIIPSKDNPVVLRRCVESLNKLTSYKNYEIIVVDNGSEFPNMMRYKALADVDHFQYIYQPESFNFSHMCNTGATAAKGDYYLFLNDDMEIIQEDWLERMLGQAQLPHVGAVGAKLYYPNTTLIQHAGVVNIKSGPSHCFSHMDDNTIYYFWRNRTEYDLLAVTAACLLVSKDKFEEIGGYNETLPIAYNDVDLCFKLVEKGYYNVIRNDVKLYHHESLSRGSDLMDPAKLKRLNHEKHYLFEMHPQFKLCDPFYSPHLIQNGVEFTNNYDEGSHYTVLDLTDSKMVEEAKVQLQAIEEAKAKAENPDLYEIERKAGDVKAAVDGVYRDYCILISGWAYTISKPSNKDAKVEVYLLGKDHTYRIGTKKRLRLDVLAVHPEEKDIEGCGFKCMIDLDSIEAGVYQVGVICDGKLSMSDKVLKNVDED